MPFGNAASYLYTWTTLEAFLPGNTFHSRADNVIDTNTQNHVKRMLEGRKNVKHRVHNFNLYIRTVLIVLHLSTKHATYGRERNRVDLKTTKLFRHVQLCGHT